MYFGFKRMSKPFAAIPLCNQSSPFSMSSFVAPSHTYFLRISLGLELFREENGIHSDIFYLETFQLHLSLVFEGVYICYMYLPRVQVFLRHCSHYFFKRTTKTKESYATKNITQERRLSVSVTRRLHRRTSPAGIQARLATGKKRTRS